MIETFVIFFLCLIFVLIPIIFVAILNYEKDELKCFNCKYSCSISIANCFQLMCVHEPKNNMTNKCPDYKRKWWKIWIKVGDTIE